MVWTWVLINIDKKTEDRMQNTEYRMQNTEYRIQNTEYRIQKIAVGGWRLAGKLSN